MPEDRQQLNGNRSEAVTDEILRRYLLGDLAENDRYVIDERLLVDDGLAEQVSLCESALIDDYVTGRLTPNERELFDRKFVVTEARKDKFRFAASLKDFAEFQTTSSEPSRGSERSWREMVTAWFTLKPARVWAFAGGAVLVLVFLGAIWLIARKPQQSQPLIAASEPMPTLAPQSSPQIAASPTRSLAEPTPNPKPQTKPKEPALSPAVATAVLMPGALRAGGNMTRIAIPQGEHDVLRLSLILEVPGAGTFVAELANADGKTVAVRQNLRARSNGQTKVTFEVPARLIQSDDYQIKLQRKTDGQLESVGRYYFRALEQ